MSRDEVGREFAPGDVALVRNEHGVWNRAILAVRPGGMVWEYGVADSRAPEYAQSRPLVVIDPEDSRGVAVEIVQRVCTALNVLPGRDISAGIEAVQDALRSLITPPKPDEPQGLGAVVEDADGVKWLRVMADDDLGSWAQYGEVSALSRWQYYDDIAAVKVLSEGWVA